MPTDGLRPGHCHRILLVEDDGDTRDGFGLFMESLGVSVVAVANGQQALDQLRSGLRPCLVVLDLAMPEVDGFAFRRAQLVDPTMARIPVVVISGAGWAVEREARSLGLTVFLRKPVVPDRLLTIVEDYCAGSLAAGATLERVR